MPLGPPLEGTMPPGSQGVHLPQSLPRHSEAQTTTSLCLEHITMASLVLSAPDAKHQHFLGAGGPNDTHGVLTDPKW